MRSNITHGHSWVNYYDILREDRDYNSLQNSDQQIKKNGLFEHLAKYIIFALNEKDFGQPQIFQARKTSLGHVCIQTREIGLT